MADDPNIAPSRGARSYGKWLAFGIAAALGTAAVWFDTAGYRAALATLAEADASGFFVAEASKNAKTLEAFKRCQGESVLARQRQCLLDNLTTPLTVEGIALMAAEARLWLFDHPDDAEVRDAALASVLVGWQVLRANAAMNERMDAVYRAESQSVVMRILADERDRNRWKASITAVQAEVLERSEWQIRMPREQAALERRKQALLGETGG